MARHKGRHVSRQKPARSAINTIQLADSFATCIDALPDEVLQIIFAGLDDINDVARCYAVCRRWRCVTGNSAALWSNLPTLSGCAGEVVGRLRGLGAMSGKRITKLDLSIRGLLRKGKENEEDADTRLPNTLDAWLAVLPLSHLRHLCVTTNCTAADRDMFTLACACPNLQSLHVTSSSIDAYERTHAQQFLHNDAAANERTFGQPSPSSSVACTPFFFEKTFGAALRLDMNLLHMLSKSRCIILPDQPMPVTYLFQILRRVHLHVEKLDITLQRPSAADEQKEDCTTTFHALLAPRLQHVRIHWSGSRSSPQTGRTMIPALAPNVHHVELSAPEIDDHLFMLSVLPTVKTLRLTVGSMSTISTLRMHIDEMKSLERIDLLCRSDTGVTSFLDELHRRWSTQHTKHWSSHSVPLPKLRDIRIDNDDELTGQLLVRLVEARKQITDGCTPLERLEVCDCVSVDTRAALTLMSNVPRFVRRINLELW